MSCKPGSTGSACELQAQQHTSYLRAAHEPPPNSSRATAKQLPRPPRQQSARKRASLPNSSGARRSTPKTARPPRAAPKQLRSTTTHSKIARERRADPQSAFEATHGRFASTLARWIAADTAAGVFLSLGRVLSAPTL